MLAAMTTALKKTIWLYAHDEGEVSELLEDVTNEYEAAVGADPDTRTLAIMTDIVEDRPMYEIGVEFSLETKQPVSVKIGSKQYRLEEI